MIIKMVTRLKNLVPRKILNFYHFAKALLAVALSAYPARRLKVIGVTGTDGKTTTCNAIYSILKQAGLSVSLISTVGSTIYGNEARSTGLHVTTPNPFLLQRLLKEAKNNKSEYVVLEATSHGLDQHRTVGSNFKVGVVTNVTPEHMDYHKTFENYLLAKAKLLHSVEYSILNRDDASFEILSNLASGKILTYGIHTEADIKAIQINNKLSGTTFEIPVLGETIESRFIGEYNVQNLLAASAVGITLGLDNDIIATGLRQAVPPPGRLEQVDVGQNFSVFVDFAHTPNSLASVLKLLGELTAQNLIVVFGCAGERDKQKRRPMGKIAAQLSDYVVITAEDPRTENLDEIMREIALGCEESGAIKNQTYFCIGDRQEAINYAIQKLAQAGDTVVTTGKAHEQSMCFGSTEYLWDELDVVRNALQAFYTENRMRT